MEAVARQYATNEHVMVIRNGWFSFRWTEIFDTGGMSCIYHIIYHIMIKSSIGDSFS